MPLFTEGLVTIPLDKEPAHVTVTPDGRRVYVTVTGFNPTGPGPGAVCDRHG